VRKEVFYMSDKECPVCGNKFKDGDKIVAVVLSEFHDIPSSIHYAITKPSDCLEVFHRSPECYDGPLPPDDNVPEVNG
jgi:hypothetical protein